jgi:2-succinyl-6-hydroxy-2,4-cyclohexadiene-1-carboxylate synthase
MPTLPINGVTYYFETQGAGRPLLLLHGFTGCGQNWLPLMPALAEKYQVVAVDLLGHGRTVAPPDESRYTIEKAAADLVALLDTLNLQDSKVWGYSMGGRLALATAVAYPHHFTHLILESTSPGLATAVERQERIAHDRELASWIETNGIAAFVRRWEQLPLWASQQQLPEEARRTLHEQRLQNDPVGLANSLRGMGTGAQPSLWPDLLTLNLPVRLVVGELDTKFVRLNEQMAAQLPHARLQIVPRAGHAVHLERPWAIINSL